MSNFLAFYCGLFAALVLLPLQALACSCLHPEPHEYLASATLVFRGKVLSVDAVSATGVVLPSSMRARFQIDKLWKGTAREEVDVTYTASDGANCGWSFKVDEEVTVFAGSSAPGAYGTSMCMMIPFDSYTGQGDTSYANALTAYRARLDGLDQRLLRNPSDRDALQERAQFLVRYKEFAAAEEAYGKLMALVPRDLTAIIGRANARYQTAQFEAALSDYDLALSLAPADVQAQRGRTLTIVKLGKPQQLGPKDRDFTGLNSGASFAGLDLRGASFKGANLSGADFTGADLRGADFSDAYFHTVNFNGAKLERARFDGLKSGYNSTFKGAAAQFASFRKANLFHASFENAVLVKADFEGARLVSTTWRRAEVRGANFKSAYMLLADLTEVHWNGEDLSGTDLRGAKLNGAALRWVSLKGAQVGSSKGTQQMGDWRGVDMATADMTDVKWGAIMIDCRTTFPTHVKVETLPLLPLWRDCDGEPPITALPAGYEFQRGPKLQGVDAKGSQLARRDLSGFGFWSTNLDASDLRGANLTNADIQGGSYDGARFDGAILKNAQVSDASFKGASFIGADLSGARLDNVNLEGAILQDTCFREDTKWPAGFDATAAGAKLCR
jgi:uncharacterized protein YjbI with pentapeptide repeats